MVTLPQPPWKRKIDRCPNCIERIPDAKSLVCHRCGYQLRLPLPSIIGLGLFAASMASLFVSAFGGFLFPWPPLPILDAMTPEALRDLFLYLGVAFLLAGLASAFAGAYISRRLGLRAGVATRRS